MPSASRVTCTGAVRPKSCRSPSSCGRLPRSCARTHHAPPAPASSRAASTTSTTRSSRRIMRQSILVDRETHHHRADPVPIRPPAVPRGIYRTAPRRPPRQDVRPARRIRRPPPVRVSHRRRHHRPASERRGEAGDQGTRRSLQPPWPRDGLVGDVPPARHCRGETAHSRARDRRATHRRTSGRGDDRRHPEKETLMRTRYGTSPWIHEFSGRRTDTARFRGDRTADVVIVGGGLTGCAVAYACAMAGLETVLLESDRIGYGSAGRSAGLLTPEPGPSFRDVAAAHGLRAARRVFDAWRRGALDGSALLRRLKIRCDLQPQESYLVGARDDEKPLRREYDGRPEGGLDLAWVSQKQVEKALKLNGAAALRTRDGF